MQEAESAGGRGRRARIAFLALALATSGVALRRGGPRLEGADDRDYGALARASRATIEGAIAVSGLERPVEVIRDTWGIPHIFASSSRDLFFAQGFVAASDRLFQMDLWRRTGEGKLAEVLGPDAIARDRFARLVRYRGDMAAEWRSYSPDAREIIAAFAAGVNAHIESRRGNLPIEFRLLGIEPEPWTPEVCVTRMAGYIMTRNAANEAARAALVRELGTETVAAVWPPDPRVPLEVPRGLELEGIGPDVLADAAAAARNPVFPGSRGAGGAGGAAGDEPAGAAARDIGSNNWTVAGRLTATGKPILANDPHRPILLPSLRYMTHLVAPGWNVIGAGEPTLPGVAVGHNERVAFGFTIVGIDQQDLYVEELNPDNPQEYRHAGAWRKMEVVREKIRVRGRTDPAEVELHFTVHGPVVNEDLRRRRAYALRWVGSEPGSAGYLASLALDRAQNWKQFLEALERWKVPSENLVYADVDGNIGWQAAGLTPIRRGWSGLLPVPGSGEYEWQGFLKLADLPRSYNPAAGYIATANHNILPPGYRRALGYEWSAGWRFRRIDDVLRPGGRFTVASFERLQHDETSLPAQSLVPLVERIEPPSERGRRARALLLGWDRVLAASSPGAALFELWLEKLGPAVWARRLSPAALRSLGSRTSLELTVEWLRSPSPAVFGPDPAAARDRCLADALEAAAAELESRLGADPKGWSWGRLHTALFSHPLARGPELEALFNRGPVARGGDGTTVNATSSGSAFRQTSGASYRQILDLGDWDRSVAVSVPGQSGEPGSPHYDDLIALWAAGKYHPLPFSRAAVERAARHRLVLRPARPQGAARWQDRDSRDRASAGPR